MENNQSKIFVGNVPFQCTIDELRNCFKNMSGFIDAQIINRYNSEYSRGFGFVTFDSVDNAQKLLNKNDVVCKDRILRFTEYNSNNYNNDVNVNKNKNYIFVRNIPKDMTRDELANYFKTIGNVGACLIATNIKTGESKGTGVVEMIDENIYRDLLNKKNIVIQGVLFEVSKWRNIKNKQSNQHQHKLINSINHKFNPKFNKLENIDNINDYNSFNATKEMYKIAFNAGVNVGRIEGIRLAKNSFFLDNDEMIG